jgi:hypothetical protein
MNERAPSWLILIFWDFGRIMAIESMERKALTYVRSKFEYANIFMSLILIESKEYRKSL